MKKFQWKHKRERNWGGRSRVPESGEVESFIVVVRIGGLAGAGVVGGAGRGAAAAAVVAGGDVGERGTGERRRVEFDGIGIGEGKAEEFGIGSREERTVREFEGEGCDASHGARTLPSRFNQLSTMPHIFSLILNSHCETHLLLV